MSPGRRCATRRSRRAMFRPPISTVGTGPTRCSDLHDPKEVGEDRGARDERVAGRGILGGASEDSAAAQPVADEPDRRHRCGARRQSVERAAASGARSLSPQGTYLAGSWPTWLVGLFSAWMMRSPQASPPTLAIAAVDGVLSPSSTFSVISSRHTTIRWPQE